MNEPLNPYEKAGRLFRLFGWIQMVVGTLILVSVALPHLVDEKLRQESNGLVGFIVLMLLFIGLSVFQLTLGKAIKEHKKWARTTGIVLAAIQLLGFPIGTLLGGYILWCLIKGWDVSPAQ